MLFILIFVAFILFSVWYFREKNRPHDDGKEYNFYQNNSTKTNDIKQNRISSAPRRICCSRCGSDDINISINQFAQKSVSNTKHQKRSMVDRAAYKTGRGMMNMATMGMWGAFTPKRGKYKEITHTQSSTINQKVAICQYCGFSWNVK